MFTKEIKTDSVVILVSVTMKILDYILISELVK